jgi:transcriptional regulator with PAS, ATPase and Fis domain
MYDLKRNMEAIERLTIREALTAMSGHRKHTARLLGISLRSLYYRMKALGMR